MSAIARRIDRLPVWAWLVMGLLVGAGAGAVMRIVKLLGNVL